MAIDPPKKQMIKVPKRLLSKEEIESAKVKTAGTPEMVKKFQDISDYNTKARNSESMAKTDSVASSNKYLKENPLVKNTSQYNQEADEETNRIVGNNAAREGNKTANKTRENQGIGVSKVMLGKAASEGTNIYSSKNTRDDSYTRNKPVEKEFPKVKK